ncbi:Phosphoserine phosphatase [Enhygromyxa salina]|uniref:Phosphoserine phosphatase n=1 Tax=Enhygromyxa salina TaxID=215803 RepID=A0A0C1Z8A6_9BACT|nr:haloacid dehalogenase-like hydrolase [Enhygromyxa salina]KIG13874.1 Phosphoserine phosphatase [Enhygromyxa salina]
MHANQTVAILDVDGTLFPGALGVELLRELMRAKACNMAPAERVLEILAGHRGGTIEFSSMASRAYGAFAEALAGRECAVIEAHARAVWAVQRERLFEFVPALISSLRARGYSLMLISGSPLEMIRLVADGLAIGEAHGAVFTREHGRYTGTIDLSSGVPGEKARIFADATVDRGLSLRHCFAIGDSITDAALFERVGLALAFEPAPELAEIAHERGWATATQTNVLAQAIALLDSTTAPVPNPRDLPC